MKHFSLANLDTVLKPFNLSYLTSSLKTMKNVSENLSDEIYLECCAGVQIMKLITA